MNKQKLLILGGAGFIGTNLLNYFFKNENYSVIVALHNTSKRSDLKCKVKWVDLTRRDQVNRLFSTIKPDIVIHAAAVTTGSKDVIERPYLHVTDNIIMNSLVFEACHKNEVKHCIFFSCSVPYKSSETPQRESDWDIKDIPPTYFGVGSMKVFSERLCEFYSRLGRTKYTAIRHSNVYGPFDKFDLDKCHVLPAMINKVCNATDTLEIWGDGSARRDLIYISDLVDFVEKCIDKQTSPYELFNCGYGKAYSINEIINTIQQILNKNNLNFVYNTSKPNIPTTVILNCEKAEHLLDWHPKTDLITGLTNTIQWYKDNHNS